MKWKCQTFAISKGGPTLKEMHSSEWVWPHSFVNYLTLLDHWNERKRSSIRQNFYWNDDMMLLGKRIRYNYETMLLDAISMSKRKRYSIWHSYEMMISDTNTNSIVVMAVKGLSHQVVVKNLGMIGKPWKVLLKGGACGNKKVYYVDSFIPRRYHLRTRRRCKYTYLGLKMCLLIT